MAKKFTSNVATASQQEFPQAESSTQPTEEHASTADENHVVEENESTRADEEIPATERQFTGSVPAVRARAQNQKRHGYIFQWCRDCGPHFLSSQQNRPDHFLKQT